MDILCCDQRILETCMLVTGCVNVSGGFVPCVSLGKVVIATFGMLIYVVRRSERRHSVMVSDYYSMKSTVERGSNVLCITVEQPSSANFAMKLMKILMLKWLLFKRYRSFKSPLAVITNTQSRWLLFHSCCYVFNELAA
ncbi:hypothetical protein T12_13159 [Trichinella patagoniensis]|uniref:Uncharacterized protein n=1 Tax=Trichinella patagoniensis TaxID=990121 RepID=A0A0V0ZL19_9BILA|nr:hypothetical protein T12_13159 [Trichinella patagoniensis]